MDLTIVFSVDQTPAQAFEAITQVSRWWSETIEGSSTKTGDEFLYRHKDIHSSRQKVTEAVPGKRLAWRVLDAELSFVENKTEWKGTEIRFELVQKRKKTEIHFTHVGLTESCECYAACSDGWNFYVNDSLRSLITTGKGKPDQ